MRTTLTLDDDVTMMIRQLQEKEKKTFKQIINDLLRNALVNKKTVQKNQTPYVTPELSAGNCMFPNIDNVAEVLAVAEREDFR